MSNGNYDDGARVEVTHSMLPLLLVLARRIRLLVCVPFACAVVAVVWSLLSDPIYTATARLLPPQYNENTVMAMQNQLGGESQLGNSALTLKNPTDLFVGILTSRTIVDAVIDANELQAYYGEQEIGEARRHLNDATEIRAAKDGIVSVSVEDTDREMAAQLANAYVAQFYAYSRSLAREQAIRRTAFYRTSLDSAREELATAEVELALIERQTGFTRLAGQDAAIVQAAAELQGQIAAREIQLKTMASYATDRNPDVRLIRRELGNLRDELTALQAPTGLPGQRDAGGGPFVGLGDVPETMLAHARRVRDVEYWENIVMLLGRFSELGKIDERRDMSLFQVLDQAIPPHDKSKPRTRVNAILAALGSGFVSLLWVLAGAYVAQRRADSPHFERQWNELTATLLPLSHKHSAPKAGT